MSMKRPVPQPDGPEPPAKPPRVLLAASGPEDDRRGSHVPTGSAPLVGLATNAKVTCPSCKSDFPITASVWGAIAECTNCNAEFFIRPELPSMFAQAAKSTHAGFYAPVSYSRADAERELNMEFPEAYIELMGQLRDVGQTQQDIVEAYCDPSVPSWPSQLIPFFQDGYGNCYCFDRSKKGLGGEHPVVFWDHEHTRDENIVRMGETDESFEAWSYRYAAEEITENGNSILGGILVVGCLFLVIATLVFAIFGVIAFIREVV